MVDERRIGAALPAPVRRRPHTPAVGVVARSIDARHIRAARHPALPLRSPVSPAPKLFSLKLFGGASLEGPAGALTGRAAQRHRLALLALLATAGAGVTRDKLIAYLWPEADAERGRHLLSNSLYMLRQALGEDALLGAGDVVRLDAARVRCDVRDFDDALGRGEAARAVGLYTGPFLDGFFLADAPEFERWATRERERLATAYARALESLAECAEGERDFRSAAEWWKTRAAHDLLDSGVALRLMRALEAAGNRAGALQHASVHQRHLQEELGLRLTPEIAALAERLRREPAAEVPDWARTPEPPAALVIETAPSLKPVAEPVAPTQPPTAAAAVAPRARRGGKWRVAVAVLVAASVLGAAWGAWAIRSRAERPERSIVVLPFVNMSSDAGTEFFSDGITEEIITQLAAVPTLKVISRTSAMHYKGRGAPLRQIAGELRVAHVLEGSVRREGDQVRITAQLIDAATDEHLWSQRYDRRLVDVIAVQEDIAREVGRALEVTLGSRGRPAAARGTRVPEAYEGYLRGRYHWQKRTKEGHEQAVAYFRRAIERDSTYADAYAGLAAVYLTGYGQYIPGFADREDETYRNLKWAAERAIALDDNSALAHRALALLRWWQRDWPGAERELLRTLELNPGDEQARNWYGALLGLTGRIDDALRETRRAYEMDPFNLTGSGHYADKFLLVREYDRAIEQTRRTIEIDPNYPFAHRGLGMLYTLKAQYPEAAREIRRAADAAPHITEFRADLAYALALAGRREEARRILDEVEALPDGPRKRDAAFSIGRAHIALGEPDSAFAWLDRADWRWPHRGNRYDPTLDPVRADPRFARLSQRIDQEMGLR
jgi:TolB-like protein/DNA-binding SARP family transcriptional activator/Tfp pilus assembly protein PilF